MIIEINTNPEGLARWSIHATEEISNDDLLKILKSIVHEMEELTENKNPDND